HAFDVIIGHSRFSSWPALRIRTDRYPSAALVQVEHIPMVRYPEIQGEPEMGIEYARREADVMRESDLVVGIGPLLTDISRALVTDRTPNFHELIPGVEILGELGEPPGRDTFNLLFVGRADAVKGLDDLIA